MSLTGLNLKSILLGSFTQISPRVISYFSLKPLWFSFPTQMYFFFGMITYTSIKPRCWETWFSNMNMLSNIYLGNIVTGNTYIVRINFLSNLSQDPFHTLHSFLALEWERKYYQDLRLTYTRRFCQPTRKQWQAKQNSNAMSSKIWRQNF